MFYSVSTLCWPRRLAIIKIMCARMPLFSVTLVKIETYIESVPSKCHLSMITMLQYTIVIIVYVLFSTVVSIGGGMHINNCMFSRNHDH